jgi:hypothetical protein
VETLFNALSEEDRTAIVKHFQEIVQQHPQYQLAVSHGISFDIQSTLQRTKNTFVKMRYWHERQHPNADASGKISNAGQGSLSDALKRFIDERHPEWQNIALGMPMLLENQPPPETSHDKHG